MRKALSEWEWGILASTAGAMVWENLEERNRAQGWWEMQLECRIHFLESLWGIPYKLIEDVDQVLFFVIVGPK